jgi:hypothetical protein
MSGLAARHVRAAAPVVVVATVIAVVVMAPPRRAAAQSQPPRAAAQSQPLRAERRFAAQLQHAFRTNDRAAVADLLRYPARVSVARRPFPILVNDRAALFEMYDLVFTPQLRCAVRDSREQAAGAPRPQYPLLLASGVVSLAGGRIIAVRADGKYQITRITSFGDTSTRGTPRLVTFRPGQPVVELGGRVADVGTDGYIVMASAGDRLQASIRNVPAGSLSIRVSRKGSQTFLDGLGQNGATWSARLPDAGEYLVEVVRRVSSCDPPVVSHLLTLSLNGPEVR